MGLQDGGTASARNFADAVPTCYLPEAGDRGAIVIGLRHCMHDGAHNLSINEGLMNSFGMASDLPFCLMREIYPLVGAGDLWLSAKICFSRPNEREVTVSLPPAENEIANPQEVNR